MWVIINLFALLFSRKFIISWSGRHKTWEWWNWFTEVLNWLIYLLVGSSLWITFKKQIILAKTKISLDHHNISIFEMHLFHPDNCFDSLLWNKNHFTIQTTQRHWNRQNLFSCDLLLSWMPSLKTHILTI